ncbi:hypothetical protein PR048_022602 [Dryococelus australis]|uniref:Uncharacterized protein n=1 Tax=Dryococelus australis TaxID=614101 RepID=A0ABQ9H1I5_9NEOP|nr:hypothetical protein PR048_022602 [Dryococelus australis]
MGSDELASAMCRRQFCQPAVLHCAGDKSPLPSVWEDGARPALRDSLPLRVDSRHLLFSPAVAIGRQLFRHAPFDCETVISRGHLCERVLSSPVQRPHLTTTTNKRTIMSGVSSLACCQLNKRTIMSGLSSLAYCQLNKRTIMSGLSSLAYCQLNKRTIMSGLSSLAYCQLNKRTIMSGVSSLAYCQLNKRTIMSGVSSLAYCQLNQRTIMSGLSSLAYYQLNKRTIMSGVSSLAYCQLNQGTIMSGLSSLAYCQLNQGTIMSGLSSLAYCQLNKRTIMLGLSSLAYCQLNKRTLMSGVSSLAYCQLNKRTIMSGVSSLAYCQLNKRTIMSGLSSLAYCQLNKRTIMSGLSSLAYCQLNKRTIMSGLSSLAYCQLNKRTIMSGLSSLAYCQLNQRTIMSGLSSLTYCQLNKRTIMSGLSSLAYCQLNQRNTRAARLRASHQGEPGSIPGRVTPGYSHVGIVPDDTSGWVFSGISHSSLSLHSALLYSHIISPLSPSALNTSLWNAREREKRETPEKIRRPTASSSTIPTCEYPGATPQWIEYDWPWPETIILFIRGAAVAERLACSPPNKPNRVQCPAVLLLDFHKWESRQTMPLVGGFFRGSPTFPALSFRHCSILTSITAIGYLIFAVKSRPNLFIHSLFLQTWLLTRSSLEVARLSYHLCATRVSSSVLVNLYSPTLTGSHTAAGAELQRLATVNLALWTTLLQEEKYSFYSEQHLINPCLTPMRSFIIDYEPVQICALPLCANLDNIDTGPRGIVVRLVSSHQGEPGSISGGVAPGFSHAGIVADDAARREIFSGISCFPCRCAFQRCSTPPLVPSSSALKTLMLRAAQITPLHDEEYSVHSLQPVQFCACTRC